MSGYRVSFFKILLSSDGHPFKCLQQQIFVSNSESAAQAADSAAQQVNELYGGQHWRLRADSIEVEAADR